MRAFAFLVQFATALCLAGPAASQSIGSASEQSIKAAYVYKFAEYVDWPEHVLDDTNAPLTFAVVGAELLANELREMTHGREVKGRPVVVRSIDVRESLAGVHVLVVGASAMDGLVRLADDARENSVLVITDASDGLELGGVINFRMVGKQIRFDVSLDSADRSQLKLSSRLLAVAAQVQPRTQ